MKNAAVILTLLIIGTAGYLLYRDSSKPTTPTSTLPATPAIGSVETVQNVLKRQKNKNPDWESLESKNPIYVGDSLRSGDASNAEIKFSDGTLIQILDSSSVGVSQTDSMISASLTSGGIILEKSTSGAQITTRGAIIRGEGAEIKIMTDTAGKSQVEVKSGKSSLLDKNNKIVNLNVGEIADLLDGVYVATRLALPTPTPTPTPVLSPTPATTLPQKKLASPTPLPKSTPKLTPKTSKAIHLELVSPSDAAVINNTSTENQVDLTWACDIQPKFYSVEFSKTADFKKIFQSDTVKNKKEIIKDLAEGNYFWRVKAYGLKNELLAKTNPFSFNLKVKGENLPELITPAAEITWTDITPIEFSWKKMEKAAKYRISIYADENQHVQVSTWLTEIQNYQWKFKENKSYWWRVKALNSKGTVISQSELRHFTVAAPLNPKEKVPTYVIISPKDQTEVTRDLTAEKPEPVIFQWQVTKTLPGPLSLIISRDPEFKDPLTLTNLTKNIQPVVLKKEGVYYWNLSSSSEDGSNLELSPVFTFNLKTPEALKAPVIISPTRDSKIDSEDAKAIKFSWKPALGATQYHFVLKKTDPKTNEAFIILDKVLPETEITSNPLEEGSYSWNVFALYNRVDESIEKGQQHDINFKFGPPFKMDAPKLNQPVIK